MDFDENAFEITVSGLVMASEWDEDDDVTAIEISTEEDTYVVEKNALWNDLADLCDTQVEVTGVFIEEKDGTRRILVTGYEPLEDFTDDEDMEYDDFYDELDFESDQDEVRSVY